MASNALIETLKSEVVQILQETFEHSNGIYLYRGTSLFESLADVTFEEASRPICSEQTTLAAQVKHTAFYLRVLEDDIKGKSADAVDWEEIWRTTHTVSPDEWDAIRDDLRTAYQNLLQSLETPEFWESENGIAGVLAMASHSAYHLGVVRQALHTLHVKK